MGQILFAPHTARILNQFTPLWGKGTATFPLFKPGEEGRSQAVELTFENSSDFKRIAREIVLEAAQVPDLARAEVERVLMGNFEVSDEELETEATKDVTEKAINDSLRRIVQRKLLDVTPTTNKGWSVVTGSAFYEYREELRVLFLGYPDKKLRLFLSDFGAEGYNMAYLIVGRWNCSLQLAVDSQGRVITESFDFCFDEERGLALLASALGLSTETPLAQIASVLSAAIYDSGQYASSELKGHLRRAQPYEITWDNEVGPFLSLTLERPKKRKENTQMGLVPELEKLLVHATQSSPAG